MATNQNNNPEFEELAKKYLDGTITSEEQVRFESWYTNFNDEYLQLDSDRYESVEQLRMAMYQRIEDGMVIKKKRKALFFKIAAAALVLITLSLSLNFYLSDKPSPFNPVTFANADHIGPGGNSAFLSLNNGTTIDLNKLVDGEKIEIEGALFQKNKDGELELVVVNSQVPLSSSVIYSTISTPKGGNYKVILPDGTRVWLNASSSLKFPVAFAQNERKVELVGEAYFDVTSNKESPFKVISKSQEVKVFGTEFNVSAYPEEMNMKTTLIEGSVRITAANHSLFIEPGEQSILNEKGVLQVVNIDVLNVKAWKDGYFAFDKLSIEEVMNQISRWYDVKVAFEGKNAQKQLIGQISKEENLSTVLQMLQYNGVNLSFESGTIVIR